MNNHFEYLKNNQEIFLNYLKEKYPVVVKSNVFLRDLEYGIKHFFELKSENLKYGQLHEIADKFITLLENEGKLEKIYKNTWKVNFLNQDTVIENQE